MNYAPTGLFNVHKSNKPFIFISYNHEDKKRVLPEIQRLIDDGYRIWYDEAIRPITEWPEETAEHLEKSSLVLVFISNNAVKSKHVRNEINYAFEKDNPILAIHLEKTKLTPGLNLQIGHRQAILKYSMLESEYIRKLDRVLRPKYQDPITPGPKYQDPITPGPKPLDRIPKKFIWSAVILIGLIIIIIFVAKIVPWDDGEPRYIRHEYLDEIVFDKKTRLMWQRSGSKSPWPYERAEEEVDRIVIAEYADWRLPTLEEARSLIEPQPQNGLYIDPIFDTTQTSIWTDDVWVVDFSQGNSSRKQPNIFNAFFFRAVHSKGK